MDEKKKKEYNEYNDQYSGYSIWLVLFDLVPVVIFLMSGVVIYAMYDSPVLLAGVIASFIGGLSKVIWKMMVVVSRRDYQILTKIFHWMLPGGFVLMLLSLLLRAGQGSLGGFWRAFSMMPALVFFLAGICGMFVMGFLGKIMDNSAKANWYEELANTITQTLILVGVILVYFGIYYHGTEIAYDKLSNTENVTVLAEEDHYLFDGPGTEDVIVFYPGAKVEAEAYAPLMSRLAEDGTDCILCRMPMNFALFAKDKADEIREEYLDEEADNAAKLQDSSGKSYKNWYLAGHSLGGVAASMLAAEYVDDAEDIDDDDDDDDADDADDAAQNGGIWRGVIFLAAYPTDKMSQPNLAIYGSEDHVLNIEKYKKASEDGLWNEDFTEVVIEGGNHAQFGSYGKQKDDGVAMITETKQQEQTAAIIDEWLSRN